nr:MAG TPA: hypothetical protein [Caudoviricetes sp.]
MQSYKELTPIDINLLKYLAFYQERDITIDEVLQEFKTFKTIPYRVQLLNTALFVDYKSKFILDESTGITSISVSKFLFITDSGLKAIEDYDFDYTERRKIRIEDRFFRTVPILISMVALFFSLYPNARIWLLGQ